MANITWFEDDDLIAFFGHGMLLNMAAAMDLMAVVALPWVRACLGQEISAESAHRKAPIVAKRAKAGVKTAG